MMIVREASLYCVYNPRWNCDDCEWRRHCTVCTTIGGMVMTVCTILGGTVMTVREASLYCVYNPGWNGDDCEGGVTVLCVQP